jgi:hypothetical protein
MKKTASAVKKTAKKVSKAGKTAKKAANKVATAATVRGKAKKVVAKLQKAQHGASDMAMRIGSTMETIGEALMSLVEPDHGGKSPRKA